MWIAELEAMTMRLIKHFSILSLLILNFHNSFSQNEKRYKSKEEDAYYDSLKRMWHHKEFKPLSKEKAKEINNDYVKITKVNNPAFYNPGQVFSPYRDTIMQAQKVDLKDFNKFDSVYQIIRKDKIGIIPKMSVLKQDIFKNNWAIIYINSEYDDFIFGGWGYWLALSKDKGASWKKYYTNITENHNLYFKRNSNISLWKDSNTIQIEATIVRKISETMHPIPAEFETIQDSIAVQLDISKITLDSDMDGLTDIVEDKMLLNPKNPDTDGDGIIDGDDKNPRFKSIHTEKALIYQTIMENFHPTKKGVMEIDIRKPPIYSKNCSDDRYEDFNSVNLLVTDDKDLQGINLHNVTMIIVTNKEYEDYKKKYPAHFIKSNYSKMFKCDRKKDTYKVHTSHFTGGSTYVIEKTLAGWKIFLLSNWIS